MKRLALLGVIVALVIPAGVAGAYDLNDDLAEVNRRIESINSQISDASVSRTAVVSDIVETRDDLELKQADLLGTQSDLADTQQDKVEQQGVLDGLRIQLQESYQALAETRGRLDDSRQNARELVVAAYVGATDGRETVTFSASSVTDVYIGLQYLTYITADNDRAMLEFESLQTQEERQQVLIKADEVDVNEQIDALEVVEDALAVLVADQTEKAEAVAVQLASLAAKLDAVDEAITDFSVELDGLEAEQARVERLIEQEASKEGEAPGILVRPVPGAITSSFGMRVHPILGYSRMHSGVDMNAGYGQEIKAGAAGRVILASSYGGYGNAIILDHGGGMTTLYAHQSSFNVSYGDQVGAGDIIGYVGSTGLSTGPHLHFEVRLFGSPVNPAGYL
ncbi:MAG: peptidoglycan DD-metalloendopeptidase family protein [Acidimicrobiia bacterium]|nr:peptidoglycan DD-metalloendopeptidase family protein [Acidimicrobiia bacterium]MDX2465953.1 peptidoglycan DD-metalloendopeptidase family protein [Acidimicrobiia bacterium]